MRKATIPFITAVLLLSLSASAVHAKSAAELLREGLYAEEVEGNLDSAIGIYQQILLDTTAPKNLVAQALYRQGMCFMKKKDEAKARDVFQKLMTDYQDQAEVVEKVKPILDELGNADPASLMPPETLAYIEIGSPGRQVGTLLNMLKGTPLENPFSIIGMKDGPQHAAASSGDGKNPVQMLNALFNPSMLAELEKVRGIGVGVLGISNQNPPAIVVLFPGKSDAVRGLLQMTLTGLGTKADPIEDMTSVTFAGGGGAAFDDTVFILASPSPKAKDLLQWSVRQYKGRSNQPSLGSANKSFARISKQARRQNALTVWISVSEVYARLNQILPAGRIPQQLQVADGLVDLKNIDDLIATLSLRETGLALEANVDFKAGYQSLAYSMIHTPNLNKADLKAIPAEAVALLSLTLGAAGTPQAQAASEKIRGVTGLDIGPEIFGNIEQISLFVVPPKESVLPQGPQIPAIARSVGLAITSRDLPKTHKLLMTLLQMANLSTAETQQAPPAAGRYELALANGMKLFGYTNDANKTLTLSLNSQLVEQVVTTTKTDRSVLSTGSLQDALATLSPATSKLVAINVGGALQLVEQNIQFSSEEAAKQVRQSLDELIQASQKTTIRLLMNEASDSFGIRLSISDLPPGKQISGPIMQLAQMISQSKAQVTSTQAKAQAAISVLQADRPPVIDGKVDDVWAGAPSHAIRHVVYTPPTSDADLSANFKTMYDSEALYFLVDVTDDVLVHDSAEYWNDDSVEIFIDAENNKSSVYGDKDYQFHFDWDEKAPTMGEGRHNKTNGVQYAFARTDKGYRLEVKLPWATLGTTPAAGKKIGLDVHVNDDDDGGDRDTKIMWFGEHDVAWQQPSAFGTAELAGLVGWWKLDESEGTKAADSSGNGHDGTVHGMPKWLPSGGKIGGALQFDGTDDYVDTGYKDDLATWTVAAWVKSPAAPISANHSGPVHREKDFQFNWNHEDPQFRGAAAVSIGVRWYAASFGDLQADTWYHLVATLDGKSLKAYKNGVLAESNPDASGVPDAEPQTLLLGRHANDNSFFAGTIDDVRVYNFALPETQIQQLYREAK